MTVTDPVFFDTNILVYAHDRSETVKCPLARQLVLDSVRTGSAGVKTLLSEDFNTGQNYGGIRAVNPFA